MKLGLISCAKSKENYPCRADEMYRPSALFSKAHDYAIVQYDQVAILSAKHGLLLPHEVIEPYEQTLKAMRRKAKKQWAERVYKQLKDKFDFKIISEIFFHAGMDYREYLIPLMRREGVRVQVPLEGLRQGKQLQWYNIRLQDYD